MIRLSQLHCKKALDAQWDTKALTTQERGVLTTRGMSKPYHQCPNSLHHARVKSTVNHNQTIPDLLPSY